MSEILNEFLGAGLIEKIDGEDSRVEKIEKAAAAIAQGLRTDPTKLIGAVLAALDPDVPASDPLLVWAEQALVTEWKSVRTIYPSTPIGLLRGILLDACQQVADGDRAAILWLTAVDMLPWMHLGREEPVVRRMLEALAEQTEKAALAPTAAPTQASAQSKHSVKPMESVEPAAPRRVNRDELLLRIAAAVVPQYKNKPVANANPHSPHNDPLNWGNVLVDRLSATLADELDSLAAEQNTAVQRLQSALVASANGIAGAWAVQQRWVTEAQAASEVRRRHQEHRLDVLWWSEAMHSRSLRCGYRELPAVLAAAAMAFDLVDIVPIPAPASVGYLLAEAVGRLPDASFGERRPLAELMSELRGARERLPRGWLARLHLPPIEGRLSLRDLTLTALGSNEADIAGSIARTGLRGDASLSLPVMARALFRQEQAIQLTKGAR